MKTDRRKKSEESTQIKIASPYAALTFWQILPSGPERAEKPILLPFAAPVHYLHAIRKVEDLRSIREEIRQQCIERRAAAERVWFITVAVNEITTNALRHGGGGVCLVRWTKEEMLVQVTNSRGPGQQHLAQLLAAWSRPWGWSGHGLRIAANYSEGLFFTVYQERIHAWLYFRP